MKTTKVILFAALMAFATIGFAQSEVLLNTNKPAPELSISLMLKSAMHNHGLVRSMRSQLNPGFLMENDQQWYTVTVNYKHTVYYITGTRDDWKYFFSIKLYPETKVG